MPIKAVQQFQLGTVLGNEKQARETLRLMKEAGYEGIELCSFMTKKIPFAVKMLTRMAGMPVGRGGGLDWKALVKEANLQVVSIHNDLGTIRRDPAAVIEEARSFGTEYAVVTGIYRFDFSNGEAVEKLADDLNRTGEALEKGGVHLLYHNHNCELRKVAPRKTAYQLLQERTDPRYVNFEFDSYWPTEAGANALELMRQLGERMKLYHINDRGTRITGSAMTPILKSDSMELGYGNMDLIPLVRQAKSVGVKAVILESHRNWVDKSPVKSFQVSAAFMNEHV
jgi:sugar phosphate isomerase/epimerase